MGISPVSVENSLRAYSVKSLLLVSFGLMLMLASASAVYAQEQQGGTEPIISVVFDKAYNRAMQSPPEEAIQYLPVMLNEIMPQGFVPLIDPEVNETKDAYELFLRGASMIVEVTEKIALDTDTVGLNPQIRTQAIATEEFVNQMVLLTQQANDMIATGSIDAFPLPIQIKNPGVIMKWVYPWPSGPAWQPRVPPEDIITGEIPMWGAFVIVKETKGMKVEVVRRQVYWNPCVYYKYGLRPPVVIWFIRLVPAEFIKTITYQNVYDFETKQAKIIQNVDKQIILEPELLDFWWFFRPLPYQSYYVAG